MRTSTCNTLQASNSFASRDKLAVIARNPITGWHLGNNPLVCFVGPKSHWLFCLTIQQNILND